MLQFKENTEWIGKRNQGRERRLVIVSLGEKNPRFQRRLSLAEPTEHSVMSYKS